MPAAANTASKAAVNFVVPISQQEPQLVGPVAEVHEQAALAGSPSHRSNVR
jgi:hypothetical protein